MAQASSTDIEIEFFPPPADAFYPSPSGTRRPFRREQSWSSSGPAYRQVHQDDQNDWQAEEDSHSTKPQGLGLSDVPLQPATTPEIKRVPIPLRQASARTGSPGFGHFSQATTARNTSNTDLRGGEWSIPQSSRASIREPPYQHSPSDVNLLPHDHSTKGCPTHGDLLKTQWSGFTVMIIFLAIFSTFFSAIFLVIALMKPRWGHRIGPRGALSYDTATLLSALLSKMVELSFATTVVVTLGQVLTRRAIRRSTSSKSNTGISIADMNMRLWIMQPGTLFTHWTGARYAVTTLLGISALIAAGATAFYTTAAESLVSPKLKFGRNETIIMTGEVSASYANVNYLTKTCATPITPDIDLVNYGITCLQIDLAGNGFRNLDSWLATWQGISKSNEPVEILNAAPRPPPVAVLFENTTVHGQWIYPSNENITADSIKWKRLVQNVTLAMPHTNVLHAARSWRNQVLQPGDLQGAGEYYLKAAVPVPALNVLCVGVNETELAPMVVDNSTSRPRNETFVTELDPIFEWVPHTDSIQPVGNEWYAPWFVRYPGEFNTIANVTYNYGSERVYVLGKSQNDSYPPTAEYILCGLRSFVYSNCSTAYHVAQSGGQLSVHCNDTETWKAYNETYKPGLDKEPFPLAVPSKDWKDVAVEWVRSVALSSGMVDVNASNARLMMQLIPSWDAQQNTILNPVLPSIAEALGVLASYTLLLSSDASPFVHYWDYAHGYLDEPAITNFTANLSYKDYASGGDQRWKGIFYVVLFAAFVQNCFCLFYLFVNYIREGELTDYTEPQNLFALAMNSPPTPMLAGTCGGGPTGAVLGRKWFVDMTQAPSNSHDSPYGYEGGHNRRDSNPTHKHFFVRYPDENTYAYTSSAAVSPNLTRWPGKSPSSKHVSWTPLLNMKRRSRMPRPKSMQDLSGPGADESPAAAQYKRLIR